MSKSAPWFKCFPEAWLEATRNLSPDHRGLYFDVLCLIYKSDGKLRDDDLAIAHKMHVHWRTWRAAKENLIAHGFIHINNGYLVNKKAQKVLRERADKRQKLSTNGSKASHKPVRNARNVDKQRAGCEQLLPKQKTKTEQLPTDREKERKVDKNILPASLSPEPLAGLSEIVDDMVSDIRRWVPSMDAAGAQSWIGTQRKLFGVAAVREGYGKLKTDLATGSVIARPLQAWGEISRRYLTEVSTPPTKTHAEKVRDEAAEFIRTTREMTGTEQST